MDAIAEAGFEYLGLMSTKPKDGAPWALVITTDTSVDEAQRAGDEARRRGLEILSVYGGGIPVRRSLEAGIDGLRKLIDNCQAARAPSLLMPGINQQKLGEAYYKAIAECCDYAAERQVELALKPHGPLNATGPTCRRAIQRVAHRNFRLWYDPGNILAYSNGSLDPVEDAAAVDGLVTGMCIKDYDPAAGVKVTPGTGLVDFPRVLSRLSKGGFVGGPLVIETVAPGDPDSLLREARKARRFVETLVRSMRGGDC
jgi:sugar phosphate isomerase/epimerase